MQEITHVAFVSFVFVYICTTRPYSSLRLRVGVAAMTCHLVLRIQEPTFPVTSSELLHAPIDLWIEEAVNDVELN
jgi:hypothetical protein